MTHFAESLDSNHWRKATCILTITLASLNFFSIVNIFSSPNKMFQWLPPVTVKVNFFFLWKVVYLPVILWELPSCSNFLLCKTLVWQRFAFPETWIVSFFGWISILFKQPLLSMQLICVVNKHTVADLHLPKFQSGENLWATFFNFL